MTNLPQPSFTNSGVELLDRDVSILAFNVRVLDWAKRPEVPLLERLRYLCIVSSNLDEFFEVRADLHMSAFRNQDTKGNYNTSTFEKVYETARSLVTEQYKLYNDVLLPSLEKQKIHILSHAQRNSAQKKWVQETDFVGRQNIKGMKAFRAGILPYANVLIATVLKELAIKNMWVSSYSLKEGYWFLQNK